MLGIYALRTDQATEDGMRMENRRTSFGYDELLACARGELFGAGNAQLPLPPMLMFDRISEIAEAGGEYGKGLVRAVLDLRPGPAHGEECRLWYRHQAGDAFQARARHCRWVALGGWFHHLSSDGPQS